MQRHCLLIDVSSSLLELYPNESVNPKGSSLVESGSDCWRNLTEFWPPTITTLVSGFPADNQPRFDWQPVSVRRTLSPTNLQLNFGWITDEIQRAKVFARTSEKVADELHGIRNIGYYFLIYINVAHIKWSNIIALSYAKKNLDSGKISSAQLARVQSDNSSAASKA